jgi:uncharacterized Zn-binding protein involved in type VI secretion
MGLPAAKEGDQVTAIDIHMIQPPGPVSPVMIPHPFTGIIDGDLSPDVNIMGMAAATVDSTATNTPSHVPIGGSFVTPPSNKATIKMGSSTVFINGKKAARSGDTAETCNDPADLPAGIIVAAGTVLIG